MQSIKKLFKRMYKIKDIEDKIPDITNLATTAVLNNKMNQAKNEIPGITN